MKRTYVDVGVSGKISRHNMVKKRISNIKKYKSFPTRCKNCNVALEYDKRHNKFCTTSCSAIYNNKDKIKEKPHCLVCGLVVRYHWMKCCSQQCVGKLLHNRVVSDWKQGIISGLSQNGTAIQPIRKYIMNKSNNSCVLCGWSEINPHTKKIPLVVDHIDGNYLNNTEENLRAICWNCDALGNTFGSLNKGGGRKMRYIDGKRQF